RSPPNGCALRLLVVPGNELVEEAHAKGGGSFWHGRGVLGRPRRPCNIEMRPGDIVDEALEELRADDASGSTTAADIFDVGGVAVDIAVVALVEGQPPDLLPDGFARLEQPARELVIVRKQTGTMVAQRHDDRTGQGRQIDNQLGFIAILAIP